MMLVRALLVLEIGLIGIGVPLAGVAYWRGRFGLANLGFIVLGVGAILGGMETMLTRSIRRTRQSGYSVFYSGAAASGWGLTFIAMGFLVALFGARGAAGEERAFIDLLIRRPGLALLPIGMFVLGTGLAQVIGPDEGRRSGLERVLALVDRAPGILLLLMSAALLAVGALELLRPALFDQLVQAFIAR